MGGNVFNGTVFLNKSEYSKAILELSVILKEIQFLEPFRLNCKSIYNDIDLIVYFKDINKIQQLFDGFEYKKIYMGEKRFKNTIYNELFSLHIKWNNIQIDFLPCVLI